MMVSRLIQLLVIRARIGMLFMVRRSVLVLLIVRIGVLAGSASMRRSGRSSLIGSI